ncbi:uncharacterized protein LOC124620377 [Schistocerca americana]|uniref:uncharacterized protein LOC124620377 n=1 Tax=Schistocerca americana TaxID=7009 RepID=UPI001F4F93C6|nr:uncharacterized protein LOC124620377 [Schistocerca americana]XP_047003007.1 uncharacterized protein LOC124620377 [Schistocerca americana]XP_047003008.1 uncharacterized protein LOC124620377 [Schistocerca americana]XP_047003009.1 uncharacterized protein LOC124620377 [Schistocerca americana]XP_047119492.1 uncharacterized protein LOC124802637 [Schistocerca piceifrons]XP_047119493.1 uncharacterized protein LOC124802637 [Schistocerca piceifrons]XP_047119494.1 uncharacterized protein LOC124802637
MDPAYRIVPDGQVRSAAEGGRDVQEVEVATPAAVDGGLQYYVVYSQDGAPVSYTLAPQVGATGGAVYCPSGATQNAANVGYQFVVGDPANLNGTPVEYAVGAAKQGPVAVEYSIGGSQVPNNAVVTYGVPDPAAIGSASYGSHGYNTPGSPESETLSFTYGHGEKCIVRKSKEPPPEFALPKGGGQSTRYYLLESEAVAHDDGILNLEQYCAFPVIDRPKVQKLYEFEIIARRPPLDRDPVLHAMMLRLYAPTSMGAKQRFWFLMRHWRRFRTMDLEIESVTQKNSSLIARWATSESKSQSAADISHSASAVHL